MDKLNNDNNIIKTILPYDEYDEYDDLESSVPLSMPSFIPKFDLNSPNVRLVSKWKDEEKALPIMNVIVCVRNQSSFDDIFERYPQNIPNGRAAVYVISSNVIDEILNLFKGSENKPDNKVVEMYDTIKSVQASNVIFYWECCQGCCINNTKYSVGTHSINLIHHLILVEKIMVMCSDFALKGLIEDWNTELLGVCPFEITGTISGHISLLFDTETLINSPSVQLQNVGKLSTEGKAIVNTLPQTISYVAKSQENASYVMKVLTVVGMQNDTEDICSTVDGKYHGKAGHVILEYEGGGILLTSNCHFIELEHISTSDEQLYNVMTQEYGKEVSEEISVTLSQLKGVAKCKAVQRQVSRLVSGSIPCKRETSQSTSKSQSTSAKSNTNEIDIEI